MQARVVNTANQISDILQYDSIVTLDGNADNHPLHVIPALHMHHTTVRQQRLMLGETQSMDVFYYLCLYLKLICLTSHTIMYVC